MKQSSANLDRFWSKVDQSGECWLWTAAKVKSGNRTGDDSYGQFWANGSLHRAHRWIYGQLVEPLIDGSAIDHLCRTTLCVRPDHLEQVTQRENILRGIGEAAQNARMDECKKGHALEGSNLIIRPSGRRRCLKCHRAEQAAYNEARKTARAAAA